MSPSAPTTSDRVLILGSGHLASRIRALAAGRSIDTPPRAQTGEATRAHSRSSDLSVDRLQDVDLAGVSRVFLVDDDDERNLEMLVALMSVDEHLPIVASLFNENLAPHLQAASPHIRIVNPARIAAPTFVDALDAPVERTLRYAPARRTEEPSPDTPDQLIQRLSLGFLALLFAATTYFHFAEQLTWLDSLYFVVVTMATVGYGDISLLHAGVASKVVGIALIVASTAFIWMIFSLTVDGIIKRRVQLALGRKRYTTAGHVILCGLGRLGYFVSEGLLARGEKLIVVERDEHSPNVEHFRRLGAEVYIGDARRPRVLQDVGVTRAKALYSVTDNDFANLEIGLNARSFDPSLRLVLRIFDDATSRRIRKHLDIHLTFSMSAIADELIFAMDDAGGSTAAAATAAAR